MADDEPRWRRRKDARPAEIAEAALAEFAERGFAAARLDDIARRAGVSKAALYLYFETKEDLFRAAAGALAGPQIAAVATMAAQIDAPFADLAPLVLGRAALIFTSTRAARLATMVIGEARNFPDLARIWREDVVEEIIALVSGLVARAQAKGEVRAGDPRLFALSLMGPMVLGGLYNAVFAAVTDARFDLAALAAEHARTVAAGLAPSTHPTDPQEP